MQDTYDPGLLNKEFDISYTSYRNLPDFVLQIKDYIDTGKNVALCDSAYSNGGDIELINYLDKTDVLDKLISYAGWNTNCNTLGTTLAQACISLASGVNLHNLLFRIVEDACYQSVVRHEMATDENDKENIIKSMLQKYYETLSISRKHPVKIKNICLPWSRLFEIGMEIELIK
jgi:hypothetical protein